MAGHDSAYETLKININYYHYYNHNVTEREIPEDVYFFKISFKLKLFARICVSKDLAALMSK
jgi:hypothetical protein